MKQTGSSYSFFMGNSSAGKNVNERSAMQMTAVYKAFEIQGKHSHGFSV